MSATLPALEVTMVEVDRASSRNSSAGGVSRENSRDRRWPPPATKLPPAHDLAPGAALGIPTDRLLDEDGVPRDLFCAICLGVVADASCETPCGHLFCQECILSSLRRQPCCPIDKKPLQAHQLQAVKEHNLPIRRMWGGIKVRCRFVESGECPWQGALADECAHAQRCQRRHGNPRDMKIRDLELQVQRGEARLAEVVANEQEARQRIAGFEDESRRRQRDFEFELERRDAASRERQAALEEATRDATRRVAGAEERAHQSAAAAQQANERLDLLAADHRRALDERDAQQQQAARHARELEQAADQARRDRDAAGENFERQRRDLEQALEQREGAALEAANRARGLEFELERIARGRSELEAEFRARTEDISRNLAAAVAERDEARRAGRAAEERAYGATSAIREAEERARSEGEARVALGRRLDACERELYEARAAATAAEEQLGRAERHFQVELQQHRRQVTPPSSAMPGGEPFDRAYSYDRNNIVKLAQLISRNLEDRPSEVSPNRIFTCIASCYDDFKRGWTDNPQNYAIDVRMLLSIASASTWFNEQHQSLLDRWLREQGWLGHNHKLAQLPPPQAGPHGGYPPPLVR